MTDIPIVELRRYPSRKLYNKNESRYVRLPEVAELVRGGANIRVEETETGEDVTRQVLLQIIMEQENQADGMLSANVLADMIRMHQSKASSMMTELFEQSVAFMRAQQSQLANKVTSSFTQPWNMFDPSQMQDMQREYQNQLASFWGGKIAGNAQSAEAPTSDGNAPGADELNALRARLDDLEKQLNQKK